MPGDAFEMRELATILRDRLKLPPIGQDQLREANMEAEIVRVSAST